MGDAPCMGCVISFGLGFICKCGLLPCRQQLHHALEFPEFSVTLRSEAPDTGRQSARHDPRGRRHSLETPMLFMSEVPVATSVPAMFQQTRIITTTM